MILDTTHTVKENEELINDLIGKSYGFLQSLKMKGIGSKRMVIDSVSPSMQEFMHPGNDITYGNIELRPHGILVHINKGLRNFTWVIPFYQLVIYKTNGKSIHAQGRFVRFKNNTMLNENKVFFNKLLDEKIKFELNHSLPN